MASIFDGLNTFAQGVQTSLDQVLKGTEGAGNSLNGALQSVIKIKNSLQQITGHVTNPTTQQVAAHQAGLQIPLSPNAQNILILVGLFAAAGGIIYAVKS